MATNPGQPDPLVTETREQALAQINELKSDRAWFDAFYNGDQARRAQWSALHDAAYGTEPAGRAAGVLSVSPVAPALPGDTPITENGVLEPGMPGYDEANEAMFAPPRGAHEYRLEVLGGGEATDADIGQILSASQALIQAGVPTFLVQSVQQVAQLNVRGLKPGEQFSDAHLAGMRAACASALEQRHGENAKAILADARKYVARIASPLIVEYLEETGAGSNPFVVETLARAWRALPKGKP